MEISLYAHEWLEDVTPEYRDERGQEALRRLTRIAEVLGEVSERSTGWVPLHRLQTTKVKVRLRDEAGGQP